MWYEGVYSFESVFITMSEFWSALKDEVEYEIEIFYIRQKCLVRYVTGYNNAKKQKDCWLFKLLLGYASKTASMIILFWAETPSSLVASWRYFGVTCCRFRRPHFMWFLRESKPLHLFMLSLIFSSSLLYDMLSSVYDTFSNQLVVVYSERFVYIVMRMYIYIYIYSTSYYCSV
jgi:hypothetical protein